MAGSRTRREVRLYAAFAPPRVRLGALGCACTQGIRDQASPLGHAVHGCGNVSEDLRGPVHDAVHGLERFMAGNELLVLETTEHPRQFLGGDTRDITLQVAEAERRTCREQPMGEGKAPSRGTEIDERPGGKIRVAGGSFFTH